MPDDREDRDKPSNGFAKRFKESYKKVEATSPSLRCKSCGTEVPAGSKTCPKCGASVLPERKKVKTDRSLDFDIILDDPTSVDEDLTRLEVTVSRDRKDRRKKVDYERNLLVSEPLARDRLSVMKQRMTEKKKEGPAPDIMGLLMTDQVRAAREKELKVDEEELKDRFVKGIESVVEQASLLEHLGDAFTAGTDAIDRTMVQTKARLIGEIEALDFKGFEAMAQKVLTSLREDRAFEAEDQLLDLKHAIRAKRAKDSLLLFRAKDLEERIRRNGPEKGKEEALKAARERVLNELPMMPEDEMPGLRAQVEKALDKALPFEAEERLLDLKLTIMARQDSEALKEDRQERIENQMKGHLAKELFGIPIPEPTFPGPEEEILEEALPELEEVEELPEVEPVHVHEQMVGHEPLPELEPVFEEETIAGIPIDELRELEHETLPELTPEIEELVPEDELPPGIVVTHEELPDILAEEVFPELEAYDETHEMPLIEITEELVSDAESEAYPELETVEGTEISTHEVEVVDLEEPAAEMEHVEDLEELVAEMEPVEEHTHLEVAATKEPEPEAAIIGLTTDQQGAVDDLQDGYEAYVKGDVKKALLLYDKSISKWPSFEAYWYKGSALLDVGMTRTALPSFEAALEIDPERLEGWLSKAEALEKLGRNDEAYEAALKAQALSPRSPAVKAAIERFRETLQESAVAQPSLGEEDEEVLDMEPLPEDELAEMEALELRVRPKAEKPSIGKPAGLVNGRGLTNGNGLVNGRGMVNGRGLVNGRSGLVNGNGLVNGKGMVNGMGTGKAPSRIRRKRNIRVVGVVVLLVLAALALPLMMFIYQEEPGITVDGSLDDWSGHRRFQDPPGDHTDNIDLDIINYALTFEGGSLFLFMETSSAGQVLNGREDGVDTMRSFMDIDNNPMTGYSIRGLGADRLIEAYGWNNKVSSASLYSFNTSRESNDWNGWVREASAVARTGPHVLELKVAKAALGPIGEGGLQALFIMTDSDERTDVGDAIISNEGGALIVDAVQVGIPILAIGGNEQPFLRLDMRALTRPVEIDSVRLHLTGSVVGSLSSDIESVGLARDDGDGLPGSGDLEVAVATPVGDSVLFNLEVPLILHPGNGVQYFVTLKTSSETLPYSTVGVKVLRSGISVIDGAVTVTGAISSKRYIGQAPTDIRIDGVFEDWADVPVNSDTIEDVDVPRIDLRDYRTTSNGLSAFFYLETTGNIMYGTFLPEGVTERPAPSPGPAPGPSPGPPPELGVLTGEDLALIYIDVDKDPLTGYAPPWQGIGAEYRVVILGKGGVITKAELHRFDTGSATGWGLEGNVQVGNDPTRMEVAVTKEAMGLQPAGAFNASFFITDWNGANADISDNVIEGDPPLALVTDGHGGSGGDQFGYSVSNAFDVNDDDIEDIIVGAPYNDNNATNAGAAYIFFGRSDFEPHGDLNATDANVTIHGLAVNGNLGWSVSGAHDVDGDGVDDVIIGEPFNGTGQAYIFYGSSTWSGNHTSHDADVQISGEVNGDEFGYSVAGPGDIDDSQNDDIVIGAPEHTQMLTIYNLGNNQGRAYVLYGDGTIPTNATNADIKLDGEYSSDNFGRAVAGAGDVNDDGIPDIIIGANENLGVGSSYIFHGGSLEGTVTVMQMTHSGLTLPVDVANMAAQAFTPSTNGRVRFVDIAATDTGANSAVFPNSATALRIEIQTDNAGLPSGNIISSVEGNDFAQFPQGSLVRLAFSTPASVNANTRYWVVASCTDAANNGYGWLYRNANVYAGGFAANYSNGAWTAQNSQDMMFNVLVWPDVVLRGENPSDEFGFAVDGAGDPNNDTIDDVIVGAPYNDAGGNNAGRAYVIYGSASMDDNIFASVIEPFPPGMGYHLNARFSRAQSFTTPASGPMITHVWWAGFEAVANPAGGVTVSLQTSAGGLPSGVNLWSTNVIPGVNPAVAESFWLDHEVAPNVQLNANTVYWIVFTSNVAHPNGYAIFPQDNNPYAGGTGALMNNQGGGGWNTQGQIRDYLFRVRAHADSRITGGSAGDRFGYAVSGAGDIDDDGNDDIVIGAPYADNGTVADAGAIYVFLGNLSFNNTAGNANFTNYGGQSNDHFGWAVDSGDFNGNGLSNILVGAPGNDTPAVDAGEASVWEVPEFQDIIIPIVSAMTVILVLRRRRVGQGRTRRRKRGRSCEAVVQRMRMT